MSTSQCHLFKNYPNGSNRDLEKENPHQYNNIWSNKFTIDFSCSCGSNYRHFGCLMVTLIYCEEVYAEHLEWHDFFFNHFDLGDTNYKYHHGLWRKHWFYCYLPGLVSILHRGFYVLGLRGVNSLFLTGPLLLKNLAWAWTYNNRTNWWVCLARLTH